MEMASLNDLIAMRGFAPDIKVAAVMDVENEFLCYSY